MLPSAIAWQFPRGWAAATLFRPSLLCYADAARFAASHHRGDDETLSTLFYRNCRALDDLPHLLGAKEKDHHRSGCCRTRRNRSAIDDPANPISTNGNLRNHCCDGRSVAQSGSRAHFAHARTDWTNRHSRRAWRRVSAGPPKTGNRNVGGSLRLGAVAGSVDSTVLSSARPTRRHARRPAHHQACRRRRCPLSHSHGPQVSQRNYDLRRWTDDKPWSGHFH